MSELFRDVASIDYPIIDCDSHVNEPPSLWQDRVPARLRERAPRVERTDKGDTSPSTRTTRGARPTAAGRESA